MIEIGRRGFFTGLAALVVAPAVIRVAPLMKISVRHTPLYVPAQWLAGWLDARENGLQMFGLDTGDLNELRSHAWSTPMAESWVNVNDYDPAFVRQWAKAELDEVEYWLS
jgi:hypothetical protein